MPTERFEPGEEERALLLRRPRFWSGHILALLLGVVVVWSVHLLASLWPLLLGWSWPRLLLLLGLLAAPLLITTVWRLLTRPRFGPLVFFEGDAVILPRSADTTRARVVPYRDVISIDLRGTRAREQLFIGTRRHLYVYPVRAFEDPEGAARLRDELRARVVTQPDGYALLRAIERRGHVAWVARARWPLVTVAMVTLLVLVYVAQHALGAFDRPFGLVLLGANAPVLVREGQLFRLVSASFLHAHFLHLYMNALALLVLGNVLERLLGAHRFVLVLLGSALCGAAASSVAAQAAYSVGASTAVFGLLGCLAVVDARYRRELPGGFRQSPRWWVVVLGLSALLPALLPQIDIAAHFGGFVTGALLTLLLFRGEGALRLHSSPGGLSAVAAIALVVAFTLGLGTTAARVLIDDRLDEVRLARALLDGLAASPRTLHRVAADFASARDATPGHLELAREAAQRAVALEPHNSAYLSNLASVYERLGLVEQAIAAQHRAIETSDTRAASRRMASFLRARAQRHELALVADERAQVRVRLEPYTRVQPVARGVLVELPPELAEGLVVYAVARYAGRDVGLFRAALGPGASTRYRFTPPQPYFEDWPEEVEFEIVLVEEWETGYAPGTWRWQYWHLED